MKLPLLIVLCSLQSACLSFHSNIDTSDSRSFEVQVSGRIAELESPGGYYENDKRYVSESTTGLLELHYDFRRGPGSYGSPYGETIIFLYEIRTEYSGIDEYIQRHAEIECDYLTGMDNFTACVDETNRDTQYLGQVRDSWHLFEYLSEAKRLLVRDYVIDVGGGVFLQFKGAVSDRAFDRKNTRSARILMFEDIFQTLTLRNVVSGATSNQEE